MKRLNVEVLGGCVVTCFLQLWGQLLPNSQKWHCRSREIIQFFYFQFTGNSSGGHSYSQHVSCIFPQNLKNLWHCVVQYMVYSHRKWIQFFHSSRSHVLLHSQHKGTNIQAMCLMHIPCFVLRQSNGAAARPQTAAECQGAIPFGLLTRVQQRATEVLTSTCSRLSTPELCDVTLYWYKVWIPGKFWKCVPVTQFQLLVIGHCTASQSYSHGCRLVSAEFL